MTEDIDMDAPQISTLRDEDSPPPRPSPIGTTKFRIKIRRAPEKAGGSSAPVSKRGGAESEDDEEEEEDQLIDDDDEPTPRAPPAMPTPTPPSRSTSKRKGEAPKRTRKPTEKGSLVAEQKRNKEQSNLGIEMAIAASQGGDWDAASIGSATQSISTPAAPPKRSRARRAPTLRTSQKAIKLPKVAPSIAHVEEADNISEVYTGTAASSPAPQDDDNESVVGSVGLPAPVLDDVNLDGVPLPVFPLPNKPFPVQAPVKIGTGFAPTVPLDRSKKKVRHWRPANREIRGIAGGRWFVRSWAGEKESEYAAARAPAIDPEAISAAGSMAIPKLPAMSISTGALGKASGKSRRMDAGPGISTAASSRSASAIPTDIHMPREPSNMRTVIAADSRADTPSFGYDI